MGPNGVKMKVCPCVEAFYCGWVTHIGCLVILRRDFVAKNARP